MALPFVKSHLCFFLLCFFCLSPCSVGLSAHQNTHNPIQVACSLSALRSVNENQNCLFHQTDIQINQELMKEFDSFPAVVSLNSEIDNCEIDELVCGSIYGIQATTLRTIRVQSGETQMTIAGSLIPIPLPVFKFPKDQSEQPEDLATKAIPVSNASFTKKPAAPECSSAYWQYYSDIDHWGIILIEAPDAPIRTFSSKSIEATTRYLFERLGHFSASITHAFQAGLLIVIDPATEFINLQRTYVTDPKGVTTQASTDSSIDRGNSRLLHLAITNARSALFERIARIRMLDLVSLPERMLIRLKREFEIRIIGTPLLRHWYAILDHATKVSQPDSRTSNLNRSNQAAWLDYFGAGLTGLVRNAAELSHSIGTGFWRQGDFEFLALQLWAPALMRICR